MPRFLLLLACILACTEVRALEPGTALRQMPGQAEDGAVEIHGVAAGVFDAGIWATGAPHFVHDARSPLLTPRLSGVFRNIYAPSVVSVGDLWLVFYGAWDGVDTGNDRIYSTVTRDFLDFEYRSLEIDHGVFTHVCNVNAIQLQDRSFAMLCTVYPDAAGLNKPAFFSSPDARVWNGSPRPHSARREDIVQIEGYPRYAEADINGVNVLLHEDDTYRIYFCDFKQFGKVNRASGKDGRRYTYEGPCLDAALMVNDVKKFTRNGETHYLMALHANRGALWYALSRDGRRFEPQKELGRSVGDADKYIVAIGWVVRGDRLFGYLYGAGASPELNRNRIFARWLQKKIVFTDESGRRYEPKASLGPDRQVLDLDGRKEIAGTFEVFGEDGATRLGEPLKVKLVSGGVYRLESPATQPR